MTEQKTALETELVATQETEVLTVVTFVGEVEQVVEWLTELRAGRLTKLRAGRLTELIAEFHAELAALSVLATTQSSLNKSALIQHVQFQSPLKKLHCPQSTESAYLISLPRTKVEVWEVLVANSPEVQGQFQNHVQPQNQPRLSY